MIHDIFGLYLAALWIVTRIHYLSVYCPDVAAEVAHIPCGVLALVAGQVGHDLAMFRPGVLPDIRAGECLLHGDNVGLTNLSGG